MARRDDPEFKWCPEGREQGARAGQILAASIKAFITAAGVSLNSFLTAIVVPDALDEAGQQILLDSLAQAGLSKVHLLPRPLAVALHWCHTANALPVGQVTEDEEGEVVGRLRILTMALDVWEAISLELRARQYEGRVWAIPVRNRIQLTDIPPELQTLGLGFALGLACTETDDDLLGWWPRVFASDWLERRLMANRALSPQELEAIREVCSSNPLASLRQEFSQLTTLRSLWSRLSQPRLQRRDPIGERWESQERNIETAGLPCVAVLADGTFADLLLEHNSTVAQIGVPPTPGSAVRVFPLSQPAAVKGAALAAAAIAHGLPCYRESLLPLDLAVRTIDTLGDPYIEWKPLVLADSVEAGRTWKPPTEVMGLSIVEGQRGVELPIRRPRFGLPTADDARTQFDFRSVATEMTRSALRTETVSVKVEVRPGQGFARAWVKSKTPGVFEARLDWKTMEPCQEPSRGELAWPPGVCVVQADRVLFANAQELMQQALESIEASRLQKSHEVLGKLVKHLRQWHLAYKLAKRRRQAATENNQLYAGVIGSNGDLGRLPAPALASELRQAIGDQFAKELRKRGQQRNVRFQDRLLKSGGWFYTAIPEVCLQHLQLRLREYLEGGSHLKPVELVAIGLSFESSVDTSLFFDAFLECSRDGRFRPNPWLQALRNIVRFRNHALAPEVVDADVLIAIVKHVLAIGLQEVSRCNFGRIFANCLETIPFMLKRRRYDQNFLDPSFTLALELKNFLQSLDNDFQHQLPVRLREVPSITIQFIERKATDFHLERLLRATIEGQSEDSEEENADC